MARFLLPGIGLVLVVAALLKWHGWSIDPVRPTGVFSHQAVQTVIVFVELCFGAWFLSSIQRTGAWLCATVMFMFFACVSFSQGWTGEASCGCFGSVKVNPWISFTFDVLIVVLLLAARPSREAITALKPAMRAAIPLISIVIAILATFFISAYFYDGSLEVTIARLRGDDLAIVPSVVDLGDCSAGVSQTVETKVANFSRKTIFVYGGTSDCSCSVLENLPVEVLPNQTKAISIRIRTSSEPGRWTRNVRLITDSPRDRFVMFKLTGNSIEDPAEVAGGQ